jgi:hypothetical protein
LRNRKFARLINSDRSLVVFDYEKWIFFVYFLIFRIKRFLSYLLFSVCVFVNFVTLKWRVREIYD